MNLTHQEIGMGFLVVICKCCGNKYKAHNTSNALTYGNIPNYGCARCKGAPVATSELSIELLDAFDKAAQDDSDNRAKNEKILDLHWSDGSWDDGVIMQPTKPVSKEEFAAMYPPLDNKELSE